MPLHLPQLIIILLIVLLLFGAKRLPEMGASIGKSVSAFKKGMNGPERDEANANAGDETKVLEAKRKELDELERELAAKKAQLAVYESSTEALRL